MKKYGNFKIWGGVIAFLLVAILPFMAKADIDDLNIENNPLRLNYTVYVGGVRALEVEVMAQMDDDAYILDAAADTVGWLGEVADWHTSSESYGLISDTNGLEPREAFISHIRRGVEIRREMNFDDDGMITVQEFKRGVEREPETGGMDMEGRRNSVDVLAGMFALSYYANNGEFCSHNVPLFDGQRRVDYMPELVGERQLRESRYSSYSGDAFLCEIDFKAIDGFDRRDRAGYFYQTYRTGAVRHRRHEEVQPARVWLAKVEENGPIIPVRFMVNTMFGNAILHLTSYEEITDDEEIANNDEIFNNEILSQSN